MAAPEIGGGLSGLVDALGGGGAGPSFSVGEEVQFPAPVPQGEPLTRDKFAGSGVSGLVDTLGEGGIPLTPVDAADQGFPSLLEMFNAGRDKQATDEEGAEAANAAKQQANAADAVFADDFGLCYLT